MAESIVGTLTMDYAVRMVKFYQYLTEEKKSLIIAKQLLRSGTSIGANVHEGLFAQSRADFINKMNIALKEAGETQYWLMLLYKTEIIDERSYTSLINDADQIVGTLVKIINTSKKNMNAPTTP